MANFDVFANVKNFLNNDSDSIDYSGEETEEVVEFPTTKPKKKGKKRKNEEDSPELIQPKSRKKRSSKVESKEDEIDEEGAAGGEKENKTIDLEDNASLENDNDVQSLSGSESDDVGDIYESHVSKFTDQRVLDEISASVAAAVVSKTRSGRVRKTTPKAPPKGKATRGRGKARGAAALRAAMANTMSLQQALSLAQGYETSPTVATSSPIVIDSEPSSPAETNQNVIATVDMTGGPSPPGTPIPMFQKKSATVINLDDGESSDDLDDSYDPDVIRVKVKFKGEIQVHKLRSHQKFAEVMKKISTKHNCKIEKVFLDLNGKIVHRDDTPHSINYKITQFLSARIMNNMTTLENPATAKNMIEVKFQSDQWRKPIVLKISKVECFETALEKLCEEMNLSSDKVKLSFDGDLIDLSSTPEDEGIEGGECIDCKLL